MERTWLESGKLWIFGHFNVWLIAIVAAQVSSLMISWPLWGVRDSPPNLPWVEEMRGISFGWPMLISLALVLVIPRWGVCVHAATLVVAIVADQFRLQPQFITLALFMLSVVFIEWQRHFRWYLVSIWLWAGLHKLWSSSWWDDYAWSLLNQAGIEPEGKEWFFCVGTIVAELLVACLASWRPRWGAVACLLLHLGIALFLSPLLANRNYSVIPWNLVMATIGARILWNTPQKLPRGSELGIALLILIYPVFYYSGYLDRALAHVLYAGNLPRGVIAREGVLEEIEGWGELAVPFPAQQRLYLQYFQACAKPGDRLRIIEPRWLNSDRYFVSRGVEGVQELRRNSSQFIEEFGPGQMPDDPAAVGGLVQLGALLLKRTESSMIYAIRIPPERFHPRQLILASRLPNLEQLQLSDCDVGDEHLPALLRLKTLRGIGVARTRLSKDSIERLATLPRMERVEPE